MDKLDWINSLKPGKYLLKEDVPNGSFDKRTLTNRSFLHYKKTLKYTKSQIAFKGNGHSIRSIKIFFKGSIWNIENQPKVGNPEQKFHEIKLLANNPENPENITETYTSVNDALSIATLKLLTDNFVKRK